MAWAWVKQMYPWTLLYSNSVTPNGFPTRTAQGSCVLGNTPLSDITGSSSYPITWQISSNFKVVCTAGSNYQKTFTIYGTNNVVLWSTNWPIDNSTRQFIGFTINEATQRAQLIFGRRYNSQGNYIYWVEYDTGGDAQRAALYPYVKAAMDVQTPDWHAVNSVSGELGTFEFSKIAQDHINGGNPVTTSDQTYIERFIGSTEIGQMVRNLAPGQQRRIYSGSHPPYQPGNYCRIVNDGGTPTQVEIVFYNAGVEFQTLVFNLTSGHKYYLSFLIDRNNNYGAMSIIDVVENPLSISYNQSSLGMSPNRAMYIWLLESDDSVIPSVNDEETPEGVNPWTPDDIDPLTAPTISAIDTGFTSMFQVTKTELQNLSDFLWSDNFVDNVKKFFNDPREIIVGISIMPVAPNVGSDMNIQAGGIDTGIQGKPLTSQYVLMEDVGEVYIQKAKGNFLDYPPYTRIVAHLPFVGEHSLDVNDVMGKTLKLSYLFDFLSGSVVASIKVDGSTNYVFGGCCGMQVPTSSEDFGRLYSSLLSAGATLGTALATVATGGMTAPLAIGAGAAMANNGMNMSPEVQHTSGSGSINGMLGNQSAYITIEIPNEKLAADQNTFVGQMCMIKKKIKQCTGYIKCYKAHLDGLTATQSERDEIESYLMNGFRRETGSTLPSVTPVTSGNTVIMFLKCSSENDVLGKTFDTVNYSKIEGKLVYNQSMLSPKFVITGDVTGYNYAYIPMFNRYYYITDIECNNGTVETVSFKVDALNSFKTQIDEFDVILERQENKVAPLLNDSQYWTTQNKTVIPKYFEGSSGKVKFNRANNVFILTIAGSNARTP